MHNISMLDILEQTAARLPEKPYLIDDTETVTFGQCREQAVRLGGALCREIGAKRRPVVLFIDKCCRCVTAMLGVLYSGNFYVPMDVKTPLNRLETILQTVEDAVIVTTERDEKSLRKIGYTGPALLFERLLEAAPADAQTLVQANRERMIDTDLMYVLFTSGSTGVPKGVAVTHRSVVDYVEMGIERVGLVEQDVFGSQTQLYVDMSLRDIYMTLKAGATVCLIAQKYFMSPKKLLQYLDEHRVTMLIWVPTAYRLVSQFDALEKVRPAYLKKISFSGEGMPVPVFHYWRRFYPDAEFRQFYGPTEITGACTWFRVTRDYGEDETIPIGKPFPNTGILLQDDEGRVIDPADVGSAGEICVFGSCLAAGYYNAPDKTAEAFVQNPLAKGRPSVMYRTGDLGRYDEDGNIVFISRKDYQIKHGGRRIELGEIETAFHAVDGVKAACCVQNRREDKLVLYYIGEVPETEIALTVRNKLPKYMIPAVYHRMEELPALSNGKLDRKTLDKWANE